MIGMVHVEFIKKKHLQEGWSIRHIARYLSGDRPESDCDDGGFPVPTDC